MGVRYHLNEKRGNMDFEQTNALIVKEQDHVVMVIKPVLKGETICWRDSQGIHAVTAKEDIPKYHKAAVRELKKGEDVLKYGEIIGHALSDIHEGEWVHTHNLSDFPEDK